MGRFGATVAAALSVVLVGAAAGPSIAGPATPARSVAVAGVSAHDSLRMRGDWKANKSYHRNDVVRHDSASWIARRASKDKAPSAGRYWQLLARDGAAGVNGVNGINGINGVSGVSGTSGKDATRLVVKDATGHELGQFMGSFVGGLGMQVLIDGGVYLYLSNGAFVGAIEDAVAGASGVGGVMYADSECLTPPFTAFESAAVGMSFVGSYKRYLEYTGQVTGFMTGLTARSAFMLSPLHQPAPLGAPSYYKALDGTCTAGAVSAPINNQTPELFALIPVAVPTTVPGPLTVAVG